MHLKVVSANLVWPCRSMEVERRKKKKKLEHPHELMLAETN